VEGYDFVHNHRQNKSDGSVGLYLDSAMEFKTRFDLAFKWICIESLFVEICRPTGKNVVIQS
jgi:hypothetical protein